MGRRRVSISPNRVFACQPCILRVQNVTCCAVFWLLHKENRICSIKCGPQISAVPVLQPRFQGQGKDPGNEVASSAMMSRKHIQHNSLWTSDDGEDSDIKIE